MTPRWRWRSPGAPWSAGAAAGASGDLGRRRGAGLLLPALLLALVACDRGATPAPDSVARQLPADSGAQPAGAPAPIDPAAIDATPLVDSAHAPAVAGEDGWMYSRSASADLDGDGAAERVVLTARAEVRDRRPLWDDGQPWQVYVEESDGSRTYLYARYVQLGAVTMRIGLGEGTRPPSVVLLEHVPDRVAVYELEYSAPGAVELVHRYERMVDPRGDLASPMLPEY